MSTHNLRVNYCLNVYHFVMQLKSPDDVLGVFLFLQMSDCQCPSLKLVFYIWPVLGTFILRRKKDTVITKKNKPQKETNTRQFITFHFMRTFFHSYFLQIHSSELHIENQSFMKFSLTFLKYNEYKTIIREAIKENWNLKSKYISSHPQHCLDDITKP